MNPPQEKNKDLFYTLLLAIGFALGMGITIIITWIIKGVECIA